jgi:CspA family cold shock protein
METGTVKWFNEQKGYGFIQPENGGKDVFVHISAVERAGLRGLKDGQKIGYELEADRRQVMALVNDQMAIAGDQVRDLTLPDKTLDQRNVDAATRLALAAGALGWLWRQVAFCAALSLDSGILKPLALRAARVAHDRAVAAQAH